MGPRHDTRQAGGLAGWRVDGSRAVKRLSIKAPKGPIHTPSLHPTLHPTPTLVRPFPYVASAFDPSPPALLSFVRLIARRTTGSYFRQGQAGVVACRSVGVASFDVARPFPSLLFISSFALTQLQKPLSTSAVPSTHAAFMAPSDSVQSVTIAMWYTQAESRGVGVSF